MFVIISITKDQVSLVWELQITIMHFKDAVEQPTVVENIVLHVQCHLMYTVNTVTTLYDNIIMASNTLYNTLYNFTF